VSDRCKVVGKLFQFKAVDPRQWNHDLWAYRYYGSRVGFQVGIGFSVYRSVFFKVGRYLLSVFQNIAISVQYFRYFTLHQSATCGS